MKMIDLREGNVFEYEGTLYITINAEHTHQQQRRGLVRLKAKDIQTGKILQDTFRSDVDINPVYIDEKPLVYLYRDSDGYHFMDNNSYEQCLIPEKALEEEKGFLTENLEVTGLFNDGKILDIKLPISVDLKVIEAEPGHKGDTVQGGKKKVKLETGIIVQTPLFCGSRQHHKD